MEFFVFHFCDPKNLLVLYFVLFQLKFIMTGGDKCDERDTNVHTEKHDPWCAGVQTFN